MAISRILLPFARLNFYRQVDLLSLRQISLFDRTVEENHEIGSLVHYLGASYTLEIAEEKGDDDNDSGTEGKLETSHT